MKPSFSFTASAFVALINVGYSLAQTPQGFSPPVNETLSIAFDRANITAGAPVPLELTQLSPTVILPELPVNSSALLLMVDLDAPGGINNHTFSPFLHWMIPLPAGSTRVSKNETSVKAVAPYIGPAPPVGTGKHRYVVLLLSVPSPVFEWPEGFPLFDSTKMQSRVLFDVKKFDKAGQFQPLAANWFTSENITTIHTSSASRVPNGSTSTSIGMWASIALALAYM
ncbi:phosphatidylethanolamine-binding protein [Mariannaea sp. PMI_226]|nr:phosphatidylethanolamine-binding protein [Mariannaea sp. PMI_226]